jgi:purine-binding chemotaxis protein CheW
MNDRTTDRAVCATAITRASQGTSDAANAGAEVIQFITFVIGAEQYGVAIIAVREIKGWSEITRLPEQPDYVRGVLNLRGVIIPIIDLRCRFGEGLTEVTALHVVIVVQIGEQLVGLLADRVSDIVSVEPSKIKPVPKVARGARFECLLGIVTIDTAMIALIELAQLLDHVGDGEPKLAPNPAPAIQAA